MNSISITLLLIAGIITTAGDIIMKKWVVSSNYYWYVIGLIIYMIGTVFLVQTYKYKNIAVASIIYVIFNVVALIFVSWFFYKEKLSGMQMIGILLGIISVTILELADR